MSDFVKGIFAALLSLWFIVSIGWFVLAIGFAGSISAATSPPGEPENQASFYLSWIVIIGPWIVGFVLLLRKFWTNRTPFAASRR